MDVLYDNYLHMTPNHTVPQIDVTKQKSH